MAPSAPTAESSLAAKARRSFCDQPSPVVEVSKPPHNAHSCNASRCGVCEANRKAQQRQRRHSLGSLQLASQAGGQTTTLGASPRLLSRRKAAFPAKENKSVSSFQTMHTCADLSVGEQAAPAAPSTARVAPPPPLELSGVSEEEGAAELASLQEERGELQSSPTSNELTESALLRSEELLQQFSRLNLDADASFAEDLENKAEGLEHAADRPHSMSEGRSPSHGGSQASFASDYSFAMPTDDSDTVKVPKVLMKMVVEMWDKLHAKEASNELEGLASVCSNRSCGTGKQGVKVHVVPHDPLSDSSPSVRSDRTRSGSTLSGGSFFDPLSASSGCLSSASTRVSPAPSAGCSFVAQPAQPKATLAAAQCSPPIVSRSQPGWTSPAMPVSRLGSFVASSYVSCAPATSAAAQSSPPAPAFRSTLAVACSPRLVRPVAQTVTVTTLWVIS